MEVKEAIEFMENIKYLQNKSDNIITYEKYDSLIKEITKLLRQGIKYE